MQNQITGSADGNFANVGAARFLEAWSRTPDYFHFAMEMEIGQYGIVGVSSPKAADTFFLESMGVPAPGAIALALIGAFVALRRGRRRSAR